MARLELYTTDWCGYCTRAKQLLRAKGVEYDEIDVTEDTVQEAMLLVRCACERNEHRASLPSLNYSWRRC